MPVLIVKSPDSTRQISTDQCCDEGKSECPPKKWTLEPREWVKKYVVNDTSDPILEISDGFGYNGFVPTKRLPSNRVLAMRVKLKCTGDLSILNQIRTG